MGILYPFLGCDQCLQAWHVCIGSSMISTRTTQLIYNEVSEKVKVEIKLTMAPPPVANVQPPANVRVTTYERKEDGGSVKVVASLLVHTLSRCG